MLDAAPGLLQWAAEQARHGPQPASEVAAVVAQRISAAGGLVDYVEVRQQLWPWSLVLAWYQCGSGVTWLLLLAANLTL